MSLYVVDIHGDIEGDYEIIKKYEEPKTGHWIIRPHVYGVTYCSECDFELKIDNTNFCPNCGARMVEEPTNSISAHDLVQEILKNNGVVDL